ncbi:hypothetical protein AWN76_011525 [Rhodothermaceae bacterium RA]|nr:hypothetical protein AWN76_011525 [Rhodothermaceae bacterium RA]
MAAASNPQTPRTRPRRRVRLLLPLLIVMAGLGGIGWHWASGLTCRQILVEGATHADEADLRRLAQVDTGAVLLDIDPEVVADRVRRHPWVAEAAVQRLPTGTVRIAVRERLPVALVLDERGRPSHYLDRDGFMMPVVSGAAYDVPVLHGVPEAYHPVRPLEHTPTRDLLAALAGLDAATHALVSELEWRDDGDWWLYTTPLPGGGSVPVRLGTASFAQRLHRLRAFWEQAVLTRPETQIRLIDLRFDSQIITRETSDQPSAVSR